MTTMRDVAAQAGVSAKSVSRVFNDDPHVLPSTRENVERAMHQRNYVPNLTSSTFRAGKLPIIGVAVLDVVVPFFASIVRAVGGLAWKRGLSTLVASSGRDLADERAAVESLLSRMLTGMILAPVATEPEWLTRWIGHTPLVFVDRRPTTLPVDSFTDDDAGAGYVATTHRLGKGHCRIAYVGDDFARSTESHRIGGYRQALEDAGIGWDQDLVEPGVCDRPTDRPTAAAAVDSLRSLVNPPTALLSSNARTSMMLAAVLKGSPLPTVGFADFLLADVVTPTWTVIDQRPARLGELAAARVLARAADPGRNAGGRTCLMSCSSKGSPRTYDTRSRTPK